MKKILALSLLFLLACASSPTDPAVQQVDTKANEGQGGTPPNCNPGYHSESQGAGGYVCVPNG